MTTEQVDQPLVMMEKRCVTCALVEGPTMRLVSRYDAIVHVGAQMLDLYTSPALQNMQKL
jgi:hypothetical protein